ncbi:hypothetical protein FPQ18DRAFT_260895, partial [Pyronema domesticum]
VHAETEVYLRRSLIGRKNRFGESSTDSIWSIYYLGVCLLRQNKYCEAKTMQRHALGEMQNSTSRSVTQGNIINCKYWLALILKHQQKYEEADIFF